MPRPSHHIFTRGLLLFVCVTGAPLAAQPTGVTFSVTPGTVYSGTRPRAVITYSVPAVSRSVVRVISSNPALAHAFPDSIVMPQGATSASTEIVVPLTCSAGTVRFDAGPRADNLVVLAPSLQWFNIVSTSLVGGESSMASVGLNGVSCGTSSITVTSSNPSVAFVPGSPLGIAMGQSNRTTIVMTNPVTAPAIVVLTATGFGATRVDTVLVLPPLLQFISVAPTTIHFGERAAGTIRLNRAAPAQGTAVQLTTPCNSAIFRVPGTVTVSPGALVAPFPVTVVSQPFTQMTCVITASHDGTQRQTTVTLSP